MSSSGYGGATVSGLRRRATRPVGLRAIHPHPLTNPVLIDVKPDGVDHAGTVAVWHNVRVGHGRAQPSLPLLHIARVHPGELQADPDLTSRRFGKRQFPDLKHVGG